MLMILLESSQFKKSFGISFIIIVVGVIHFGIMPR